MAPPSPAGRPAAHPWRRLAAAVIDALVLLVPCAALVYVHPLAALAAATAYGTFFESRPGHATPGKRACGIDVVATNGEPVGVKAALVRNAIKYGSLAFSASVWGFVVPLAMFAPAFTPRRQGLHDLAARTRLLHEPGMGLSDIAVGPVGLLGPFLFVVALLPLMLSPFMNRKARQAVETAMRDAAPQRARVEAYFRANGKLPAGAAVEVHPAGSTGSVVLVPEVHDGSVRWICQAHDIPRGKVPAECRGEQATP